MSIRKTGENLDNINNIGVKYLKGQRFNKTDKTMKRKKINVTSRKYVTSTIVSLDS